MSGQNRARPPLASSVIYITDENEDECVQALQAFLQKSEASPASTETPDDKQAVTRHLTVVLEWANESMQKFSAGNLIDEAERSDLIGRLDNFVARCQERVKGLDEIQREGKVAFSLSWLGSYDSQEKRRTLVDHTTLGAIMGLLKEMKGDDSNLNDPSRLIVRLLKLAYLRPLGRCAGIYPSRRAPYIALDAHTDADVALKSFLTKFQDRFIDEHDTNIGYYARGIFFVQSQGCGKSRLIRNVGLKVPSFHIHVTNECGQGQSIPAPDKSVCEFLSSEEARNTLGHVVAAAFISALFHRLYVYVAERHQKEAKVPPGRELRIDYGTGSLQSLENSIQAATCYLSQYQRHLSVEKQLCVWLRDLRSGGWHGRSTFLQGVIRVAGLILRRRCREYHKYSETVRARSPEEYVEMRSKVPARRASLDYLGPEKTGLVTNVKRFFELIDGAIDGKGYKLCDSSQTEVKPHQFIFGIDQCRFLGVLMGTGYEPDAITRPGMQDEEDLHTVRAQGRFAFLRVFHDMAAYAKTAVKGGEDTGISDPLKRVWLVLIDSSLQDNPLTPTTYEEKSHASKCEPWNFKGLLSRWCEFGMDHAFNIDNNTPIDGSYLIGIKDYQHHPIKSIQSFKHIKRMGRGIWAAHYVADRFVLSAMEGLLNNDFIGWQSWPLFTDKQRYDAIEGSLDDRTFAIASLRFCTDAPLLNPEQVDKIKQTKRQVALHSRHLITLTGRLEHIQTSTPAEPALSLAALVTLNYGKSLFTQWSQDGVMRPLLNIKAVKNKDSWKRMLVELSKVFGFNSTVVSMADLGSFVARVILTLARDATLPEVWEDHKEEVPFTTLRQFIEKLIGEDEAEELFLRNVVINLDKAVVNFNQFIPLFSPVGDPDLKGYSSLPMIVEHLIDGFVRQVAYIALNGQGYSLIIPIGIPKGDTTTPSYGGLKYCYDWQYVAISVKTVGIARGAKEALYSSPIWDVNGSPLAIAAAMVILMDLGTDTKFLHTDDNYISVHVAADSSKAETKILVSKENCERILKDVTDESRFLTVRSSTLHLRIRGLLGVYPELNELDPENKFGGIAKDEFRIYDALQPGINVSVLSLDPAIHQLSTIEEDLRRL